MRLLLLGEPATSARYLVGTFTRAKIDHRHVESKTPLERLDGDWDAVILSDYPAARLGPAATDTIARKVSDGAGLIMIGGWTSFNGQGTGYRGTPIADLLPVACLEGDDRRNVHGGFWFEAVQPHHPALTGLDLADPPVLCGHNAVTLRPEGVLLAQGRLVEFRDGAPRPGAAVPLLATRQVGRGRSLAFTSDLVPHWCGGIVDWGAERVPLPGGAEVGAGYCAFLTNIVRWVAGEVG
jgi:uncharacterized membrane protein